MMQAPMMMPPMMAPPKDNTFMLFGLVVLIVITILYFNNRTQDKIGELEKKITSIGTATGTGTPSYAVLSLSKTLTTNIGSQDHIVFDVNDIYSPNKDIVRLSGAYTKEYGRDCIGRYLLSSGTWKIIGNIGTWQWASADGMVNLALVNADNGLMLSNGITIGATDGSVDLGNGGTTISAIFKLSQPARVEFRLINQKNVSSVGWSSNDRVTNFGTMPTLVIQRVM